tara:strand:+ start:327 stop:989 length:663 start_codon:yes stop_codon:yes gene_type:complete
MEYEITRRNSPSRRINIPDMHINNLYVLNKVLNKENNYLVKKMNILFTIIILMTVLVGIVCGLYIYSVSDKVELEEDIYKYNSNRISINTSTLKSILNNLTRDRIEYILNDMKYELVTNDLIKDFIINDKSQKTEYIEEKNDCDNFSYILYGKFLEWQYKLNTTYSYVFGVVYLRYITENTYHTMNIFINTGYDIYCMESQIKKFELCSNENIEYYRVIV